VAGLGHVRGKKGKGGRKIGRDVQKCTRYKLEGRREKNKARRIAKQSRFEQRKRLKRSVAKRGEKSPLPIHQRRKLENNRKFPI
jgi:hypothetical protein